MNKNQVAKQYSRALVNSIELSAIPDVVQEFKSFAGLLDSNRQLKLLFSGQIFSEGEKGRAFDTVAPSLKFNAGTEKFLKLIITRGHLSAIQEIIAATVEIYNERQKKAEAVVVSSVALQSGHVERLKKTLKEMTDREITVKNTVDESLLGGFIVKIGSRIFDSSVKGQLRLLKTELMR